MFSRTTDHKSRETKRSVNGKSAVPSILSAGARFVGDLTTDGDVHIDGNHQGEIHANAVHVSRDGVVAGAITADFVHVEGRVDGAIAARAVTLGTSSRVLGDVHHETLTIEPGARLRGQCVPHEEADQDEKTAIPSQLGPAPAALANSEPDAADTENPAEQMDATDKGTKTAKPLN